MRVNEDAPCIVERIHHVHLDALTHEGMATTLVDDFALRVHHIVILEETLTDTEVIFLYLLLCTFNGLVQHAVLKYFSFLKAHLVHHSREAIGGEEAHEVVLKRNKEH